MKMQQKSSSQAMRDIPRKHEVQPCFAWFISKQGCMGKLLFILKRFLNFKEVFNHNILHLICHARIQRQAYHMLVQTFRIWAENSLISMVLVIRMMV